MESVNQSIFEAINTLSGKFIELDYFAIFLAEYTPYFFIFCLIFLWFFRDDIYKNITLLSGYSVLLGLSINFLISLYFHHNRPFVDGLGISLVPHLPDNSFPSDHTTFMLSIAFLFFYFSKTRMWGIFLSFLGIISGFSRVFVGVHYPFDIMGSIIVALLSSGIIFVFQKRFSIINTFFINFYKNIKQLAETL